MLSAEFLVLLEREPLSLSRRGCMSSEEETSGCMYGGPLSAVTLSSIGVTDGPFATAVLGTI